MLGRLLRKGCQRVQVHARTEGFACAGEDHHAGGARFSFFQRGEQLLDHFGRNGVALLRPVERDCGDITLGLERQGSVGHGGRIEAEKRGSKEDAEQGKEVKEGEKRKRKNFEAAGGEGQGI